MPVFTVHQGKRYRATITLGLFQSLASNETVAGKVKFGAEGEWEKSRFQGRELRGKTMGIVGLGLLMQIYHPPLWQQLVAPVFFLAALAAMGLGAWLLWSIVHGR